MMQYFIKHFNEISIKDVNVAGGKNASLEEMLLAGKILDLPKKIRC